MYKRVTCTAPVNIATIKYWGKRDENLILPLNDSISVTLGSMRAKTTIYASPHFKEDRMWLNNREEKVSANARLLACLNEIRQIAREQGKADSDDLYNWKLHICSENDFPTAAGLASSAAGYAALVVTLAELFGIEGDLTTLARRGSGSACRSIYGGFVQWHKGTLNDGTDSKATQLFPASHWPELKIFILIVQKEKKLVSSTIGMKRSALTSELLKYRVEQCVPQRVTEMADAIKNRDFPRFAKITMQDSNQFHAVALDTYPPAVYMNDVSHNIASLVHAFNSACDNTRLAYTFDAGANACLFLLEEHAPLVSALLRYYIPDLQCKKYPTIEFPAELVRNIALEKFSPGSIQKLITADVGNGPEVLGEEEHLLNIDGNPINNN